MPVASLTTESSFVKDQTIRVLCLICWLTARSIMFDVLIFPKWFLGREKTVKASGTLFSSQQASLGVVLEYLSTIFLKAILACLKFSAL